MSSLVKGIVNSVVSLLDYTVYSSVDAVTGRYYSYNSIYDDDNGDDAMLLPSLKFICTGYGCQALILVLAPFLLCLLIFTAIVYRIKKASRLQMFMAKTETLGRIPKALQRRAAHHRTESTQECSTQVDLTELASEAVDGDSRIYNTSAEPLTIWGTAPSLPEAPEPRDGGDGPNASNSSASPNKSSLKGEGSPRKLNRAVSFSEDVKEKSRERKTKRRKIVKKVRQPELIKKTVFSSKISPELSAIIQKRSTGTGHPSHPTNKPTKKRDPSKHRKPPAPSVASHAPTAPPPSTTRAAPRSTVATSQAKSGISHLFKFKNEGGHKKSLINSNKNHITKRPGNAAATSRSTVTVKNTRKSRSKTTASETMSCVSLKQSNDNLNKVKPKIYTNINNRKRTKSQDVPTSRRDKQTCAEPNDTSYTVSKRTSSNTPAIPAASKSSSLYTDYCFNFVKPLATRNTLPLPPKFESFTIRKTLTPELKSLKGEGAFTSLLKRIEPVSRIHMHGDKEDDTAEVKSTNENKEINSDLDNAAYPQKTASDLDISEMTFTEHRTSRTKHIEDHNVNSLLGIWPPDHGYNHSNSDAQNHRFYYTRCAEQHPLVVDDIDASPDIYQARKENLNFKLSSGVKARREHPYKSNRVKLSSRPGTQHRMMPDEQLSSTSSSSQKVTKRNKHKHKASSQSKIRLIRRISKIKHALDSELVKPSKSKGVTRRADAACPKNSKESNSNKTYHPDLSLKMTPTREPVCSCSATTLASEEESPRSSVDMKADTCRFCHKVQRPLMSHRHRPYVTRSSSHSSAWRPQAPGMLNKNNCSPAKRKRYVLRSRAKGEDSTSMDSGDHPGRDACRVFMSYTPDTGHKVYHDPYGEREGTRKAGAVRRERISEFLWPKRKRRSTFNVKKYVPPKQQWYSDFTTPQFLNKFTCEESNNGYTKSKSVCVNTYREGYRETHLICETADQSTNTSISENTVNNNLRNSKQNELSSITTGVQTSPHLNSAKTISSKSSKHKKYISRKTNTKSQIPRKLRPLSKRQRKALQVQKHAIEKQVELSVINIIDKTKSTSKTSKTNGVAQSKGFTQTTKPETESVLKESEDQKLVRIKAGNQTIPAYCRNERCSAKILETDSQLKDNLQNNCSGEEHNSTNAKQVENEQQKGRIDESKLNKLTRVDDPIDSCPKFLENKPYVQRPSWGNANLSELDRRVKRALKLREEMQLSKNRKEKTPTLQLINQVARSFESPRTVDSMDTEDLRPSDTDDVLTTDAMTSLNPDFPSNNNRDTPSCNWESYLNQETLSCEYQDTPSHENIVMVCDDNPQTSNPNDNQKVVSEKIMSYQDQREPYSSETRDMKSDGVRNQPCDNEREEASRNIQRPQHSSNQPQSNSQFDVQRLGTVSRSSTNTSTVRNGLNLANALEEQEAISYLSKENNNVERATPADVFSDELPSFTTELDLLTSTDFGGAKTATPRFIASGEVNITSSSGLGVGATSLEILTDELYELRRHVGRCSSIVDTLQQSVTSAASVSTSSALTPTASFLRNIVKKTTPPTKLPKDNNKQNDCLPRLVGELVESLPQVPTRSIVDWFLVTSDPRNFDKIPKVEISSNEGTVSKSYIKQEEGRQVTESPIPKKRLSTLKKLEHNPYSDLTNISYCSPKFTDAMTDLANQLTPPPTYRSTINSRVPQQYTQGYQHEFCSKPYQTNKNKTSPSDNSSYRSGSDRDQKCASRKKQPSNRFQKSKERKTVYGKALTKPRNHVHSRPKDIKPEKTLTPRRLGRLAAIDNACKVGRFKRNQETNPDLVSKQTTNQFLKSNNSEGVNELPVTNKDKSEPHWSRKKKTDQNKKTTVSPIPLNWSRKNETQHRKETKISPVKSPRSKGLCKIPASFNFISSPGNTGMPGESPGAAGVRQIVMKLRKLSEEGAAPQDRSRITIRQKSDVRGIIAKFSNNK